TAPLVNPSPVAPWGLAWKATRKPPLLFVVLVVVSRSVPVMRISSPQPWATRLIGTLCVIVAAGAEAVTTAAAATITSASANRRISLPFLSQSHDRSPSHCDSQGVSEKRQSSALVRADRMLRSRQEHTRSRGPLRFAETVNRLGRFLAQRLRPP